MPTVVTFDAGQTLLDLDLDFLAARLAERGQIVDPQALRAAMLGAWRCYDKRVEAGRDKTWHAFMSALLSAVGLQGVDALVEWLWSEQPSRNLWRAPIADMVALTRELAARGVRLAVLSNSEGKLAELLVAIGIADPFAAVIDSGRIGVEKPDPLIFAAALAAVGATTGIHVGDSWSADVEGALGAGWRAVWYGRRAVPVHDARVAVAHDAAGVRAALARWAI